MRHVNFASSRLVNLLLNLNLLLHFDLLAALLLLRHLRLSLGFGLCLHFRDLFRGEAGGRVVIFTELSHLFIGRIVLLGGGEHTETTKGIQLGK